MSARRLAPASVQPKTFAFSSAASAEIDKWVAKYPDGRQRSALIPALWIAQKDAGGWLPEVTLRAVGDRLGMAYIRVLEVATFYTMFNLAPVGEFHIQLCGTTPCWLRGSDDLKAVLERKVGPQGTISGDGKFSWIEVECLGACANAPMCQISTDVDEDPYYEDLTPETFEALIDNLAAGNPVERGPQNGRLNSAPEGGPTVLTSADILKQGRKLTTLPNQDKKVTLRRHAEDPKGRRATTAGRKNKPKKPSSTLKSDGELLERPEAKAKPDPKGMRAVKKARPKSSPIPAAKAAPKVLYTDGPTDGAPDDLKKIKGIGPKFEGDLNGKGVYYFRQIAAWKAADIKMVEGVIDSFPGRIKRDEWVKQAKRLAKEAAK